MKDLFDSVTPSTIPLYVRAIGLFSRCDLTFYLGRCTHLTITFVSSGLPMFRLVGQFTPVLALYDPFGVDVPLIFDIIIIVDVLCDHKDGVFLPEFPQRRS